MSAANERRRLRVMFCHFTADVCGGSDRSLYDLVTRLPRDRFEPTLILRRGDPLSADYRRAGLPVIERKFVPPRRALEPVKLLHYFARFLPSALTIARDIRRFRADVVHVNTLFNVQGAVGAWLARKPLVWHVRELVPDSRVVGVMLALVAGLSTRAVANSTAVLETLHACGGRARVVFNGIDTREYVDLRTGTSVRDELGVSPSAPVVTTIGRIEPWKGQHVFLEAVPAILRAHPAARFLVVGGAAANKPEYLEQLRARCAEMGLSDRVLFTGIRKDIPEILAASTVVVLPSVTPEPFGRAIVEAMLARKPVVATAAGGPLDIILEGETGLLTPPGDSSALAAQVNALLADAHRAATMGEQARERALSHFALERVVEDMASLLEEAAGRKG